MFRCVLCNNPLTREEHKAGRCPACVGNIKDDAGSNPPKDTAVTHSGAMVEKTAGPSETKTYERLKAAGVLLAVIIGVLLALFGLLEKATKGYKATKGPVTHSPEQKMNVWEARRAVETQQLHSSTQETVRVGLQEQIWERYGGGHTPQGINVSVNLIQGKENKYTGTAEVQVHGVRTHTPVPKRWRVEADLVGQGPRVVWKAYPE